MFDQKFFDEQFLRHSYFDFKFPFIVNESHGYVNVIQKIISALNPDVNKAIRDHVQNISIKDMSIFHGIDDLFFDEYVISLRVIRDKNIDGDSDGRYSDHSPMSIEGGKIKFKPMIHVDARGSSDLTLIRCVLRTIGHEFTHAYNDYEIFRNSKGKKRLSDCFMTGYSTVSQGSENETENYVDKIIYLTDRSEMNSHIAQMIQELESLFYSYQGEYGNYNVFTDPKTLLENVKKTKTYEKMQEAFSGLKWIDEHSYRDDVRKATIEVVNGLTNYSFKSYHAAFQLLKYRMSRFKKKFDDNAMKIVHDLYMKHMPKFR